MSAAWASRWVSRPGGHEPAAPVSPAGAVQRPGRVAGAAKHVGLRSDRSSTTFTTDGKTYSRRSWPGRRSDSEWDRRADQPAAGGQYQLHTAGLQVTLATTLGGLLKLPGGGKVPADVWRVVQAANRLAHLPAADPGRLVELADDRRPLIHEMAPGRSGSWTPTRGSRCWWRLSGTIGGEWRSTLLRRAMAGLPGPRVMDLLRDAPRARVTVAKEVVRLVGTSAGRPASTGYGTGPGRTCTGMSGSPACAPSGSIWSGRRRGPSSAEQRRTRTVAC